MNSLFKHDVKTLLHHVAYGDPETVKKMLEENPKLLMWAIDVEDPVGNKILGVTAYECALGAKDLEMAAMIGNYFSKLPLGEGMRLRQAVPYHISIKNMLEEKVYDFTPLLKIIKESNADDVIQALALNAEHKSELWEALGAFRRDFSPREIKGGMHFNYANLLEAFEVYLAEYDNLIVSGNNYDKCDIFWRQVIGYIQRSLPSCDCQAFAQGIYFIVQEEEPLRRSFDFRARGGSFPITKDRCSTDGLGFEFSVGTWGFEAPWSGGCGRGREWFCENHIVFYVKQKISNLQNLFVAARNNPSRPIV